MMSYATIDASSGNVEATVTKDNEHIKELKTQIVFVMISHYALSAVAGQDQHIY